MGIGSSEEPTGIRPGGVGVTEVSGEDPLQEGIAGSGFSARLAGSLCNLEDLPSRIICVLSVLGC